MWRFALSVGLLLGIIVGLVGYGRVLPVYLAVRVLLVFLGTTVTIVGAERTVNLLMDEQQAGTTSPQVKEVDLGNLDSLEDQEESEGAGDSVSDEGFPDESDTATELEEDAEIEELADMVSETMKDEETEE